MYQTWISIPSDSQCSHHCNHRVFGTVRVFATGDVSKYRSSSWEYPSCWTCPSYTFPQLDDHARVRLPTLTKNPHEKYQILAPSLHVLVDPWHSSSGAHRLLGESGNRLGEKNISMLLVFLDLLISQLYLNMFQNKNRIAD